MDDIFLKNPQLLSWLKHSEESIFLNEDDFEFIKELLHPIDEGLDKNQFEGPAVTQNEGNLNSLVSRISQICTEHSRPYFVPSQYRLQALKGIWQAQSQLQQKIREKTRKQVKSDQAEKSKHEYESSDESELSLRLIVCLLESQSRVDPSLTEVTTRLLSNHFRSRPPLHLKEQPQHLKSLENLLHSWLESSLCDVNAKVEETATALVTLACAYDSRATLIRTIHILKTIEAKRTEAKNISDKNNESEKSVETKNTDCLLDVRDVITALVRSESQLSVVKIPEMENFAGLNILNGERFTCKSSHPRRLKTSTCDGQYLYIGNDSGCRMIKVGTGFGNTVRGFVYAQSRVQEICESGFIALANNILIQRPLAFDEGNELCNILDANNLEEVVTVIQIPELALKMVKTTRTIHLISNGVEFYWLRSVSSNKLTEELTSSKNIIILDVFTIDEMSHVVSLVRPRVILSKQPVATCQVLECLAMDCEPASSESEVNTTTTGLTMTQLFSAAAFTCGTHITFLIPSESEPNQVYDKQSQTLFTTFTFGTTDGLIRQEGYVIFPYKVLTLDKRISSTYDALNHRIWLIGKEQVIEFKAQGFQPNSFLKMQCGDSTFNPSQTDSNLLPINVVSSILVQHLGLNACKALGKHSSFEAHSKSKEKPIEDLTRMFEILKYYQENSKYDPPAICHDPPAMCSVVSVIRLLIVNSPVNKNSKEIYSNIENEIWKLLKFKKSLTTSIRSQALLTLVETFYKINVTPDQQRSALNDMFNDDCSTAESIELRELILSKETAKLDIETAESFSMDSLTQNILKSLVSEGKGLILTAEHGSMESLKVKVCQLPSQSVSLKFCSTLVRKISGKLLNTLEGKDDVSIFNIWNELSSILFQQANLLLTSISEVVKNFETKFKSDDEELNMRMKYLNLASWSTILGSLLPTLINVQTHILKDSIFKGNVKTVTNLVALACQLAAQFEGEESTTSLQLSAVSPWTSAIQVETPHPVKDGFKMSEAIQIPGAKRLVIYFDPKCSTQNDYDKLVLTNGVGKKLAEFGGNPFGQGNKRTLGSGWPTRPVVVEGDSVNINFEVKSRREADTMDKSAWGFGIIIGPVYRVTNKDKPASHFSQLALSLVPVIGSLLAPLYEGSPKAPEESECRNLLESKLLQRCIWKSASILEPSDFCPIFFPWEVMKKLKSLTCCKLPILRSSLKTVICPEIMEEKVLTVVIKHMGLSDTVNNIGLWEQENSTESYILAELVSEVYLKIGSLIRRLQVLANLETQWSEEVARMRQGEVEVKDVFFQDYLHHESKTKELALLCFLKGVHITEHSQEQKIMQELKDIIEKESRFADHRPDRGTTTESIVKGIFARLDLLLRVDISTDVSAKVEETMMTRSLQSWPGVVGEFKGFKRQLSELDRAMDDSILQIPKLQSRLNIFKGRKSALDAVRRELHQDASNKLNLLEQLFCFIGYKPEEAVSTKSFLKAVSIRRQRNLDRIEALKLMRTILESAGSLAWAFVTPMADILQKGLRSDELTCGNMATDTSSEFCQTISMMVRIIRKQSKQCISSIGYLSIIPYRRSEENCLLKSQLVRLLDDLCDAQDLASGDQSQDHSTLAQVAWLGFKVLAQRCIAWEEEDQGDKNQGGSLTQKCEPSSLETQISNLLANYLVKATRSGNFAIGNEALQEVLVLLSALSKSRLGKGILSQPACVSKLLQLLMEPYLSPKVTMTIVKLASVSLPIMTREACNQLTVGHLSNEPQIEARIVSLLLTKLSDYLIPETEAFHKTAESQDKDDVVEDLQECLDKPQNQGQILENTTKLSLFVHKRKDQSAHEIIQLMLNSTSDMDIFTSSSQESMEKVVRMDKELNGKHCAEVMTNDATVIFRIATRMAQQGFVVSVSTPWKREDGNIEGLNRMCRKRNEILARKDPGRPFLSSEVANELAAELISLIHNLMKSNSAIPWREMTMNKARVSLQKLGPLLESAPDILSALTVDEKLTSMYGDARQVVACLALLGGFTETLKPGVEVKNVTSNSNNPTSAAMIVSTTEDSALLNVDFHGNLVPVQVSKRRIEIFDKLHQESRSLFMSLSSDIISAMLHVFTTDELDPLSQPLPVHGPNIVMEASRLIAEIRTRTCQLLALYMQKPEFCCRFLRSSCQAVDLLKYYSKDCLSADKLCCIRATCINLRSLYRDCIKPPKRIVATADISGLTGSWDPSQNFPPLKSLLVTRDGLGLTYLGDPVSIPSLPRGVLVYSTDHMTKDDNQFSVEIVSLGEALDESGAVALSIGLAPLAEKRETWSYPNGSVFLHNNGRAVHYNGPSLLQWRSIRLDQNLNPGDRITITCLDGKVLFSLNDVAMEQCFDEVAPDMYPVVHIQKKGIRIKASFGKRKSQGLVVLAPKEQLSGAPRPGAGHRRSTTSAGRPAMRSKTVVQYNIRTSSHYCLATVGQGAKSGNPGLVTFNLEDEDSDDCDADGDESDHDDDLRNLNGMLVKAWETTVFPAIRRRFRNENERRDGLEQIKGALALGMLEIARQTVEFLYEENGGIPRDLKLPTLDDVRKQMMQLTAEKLKVGQLVDICATEGAPPKFASGPQIRTFGLNGEVLQVDCKNDLVEVETYLKEEGILVSHWYPISFLKKPVETKRKKFKLDSHVHANLLNNEFALGRLYCRQAYVDILRHSRNQNLDNLDPDQNEDSNILLLREFDFENLTFMVEDSYSSRLCSLMNLHENNLDHNSAQEIATRNTKNILDFLLVDRTVLQTELKHILIENDLTQTSFDKICECLEAPSRYFTSEEIVINDISMLSSVVRFDGAEFVIVTCRFDQEEKVHPEGMRVQVRSLAPTAPNNSLGHCSTNAIFHLPSEAHDGGRDPVTRALPVMLFPTNLLKICHSGGGETNILLQLDAIPTQFIIAIGLIEQSLVTSDNFPMTMRFELADFLVNFLDRYLAAPALKELLFHLLARLVRFNHLQCGLMLSPDSESVLASFMSELKVLYETEKPELEHRMFSTYLQTLFELACAWVQVNPKAAIDCPDILQDPSITRSMALLEALVTFTEGVLISQEILEELEPRKPVPVCSSRMLVLHGIPKHLKTDYVKKVIQTTLDKIGGIYMTELFVPVMDLFKDSNTAASLGQNNSGCAVVEFRVHQKLEEAKAALEAAREFHQHGELDVADNAGTLVNLTVSKVDPNMACIEENCQEVWRLYLQNKLVNDKDILVDECVETLATLFQASCSDSVIPFEKLCQASDDNKLYNFFKGLFSCDVIGLKQMSRVAKSSQNLAMECNLLDEPDSSGLTQDSFLSFVLEQSLTDPVSVMRGLKASGIDFQFNASAQAQDTHWDLKQDSSLVHYVNCLAHSLNVSPLRLDPSEIILSEDVLLEHSDLRDVTLGSARYQFSLLQAVNLKIEQLLRLTDFRPDGDPTSNASIISNARSLLFYSVKSYFLDKVINCTRTDTTELPTPTITLDPVESIGQSEDDIKSTWFYQSMTQLALVSSLELCVPLAAGADPHYPFLVKMSGENVEGHSGSFRQLLAKLVDELHGPVLYLLMPYMGEGTFKGRYIMRPGPVTLVDERLLQHFGRILGLGLRSGIPLPLDLVSTFWKTLVQEPLTDKDLAAFDPIVSGYVHKIQSIKDESKFNQFLEENQYPRFTHPSVRGDLCDLVQNGSEMYLSWDNRKEYCKLIRDFRLREMSCEERIVNVVAGLATIVPVNILAQLFTAEEVELRICGQHKVDIEILKKYTIYQVGLYQTDQHIQFFWTALENFDDRQRQRFIKFACNQDRIPTPTDGETLPSPYPMKLAPSDKREEDPDTQNIRVETCMFMVKLPRYSTYEKMREKLLFAINSAFDPLSG